VGVLRLSPCIGRWDRLGCAAESYAWDLLL